MKALGIMACKKTSPKKEKERKSSGHLIFSSCLTKLGKTHHLLYNLLCNVCVCVCYACCGLQYKNKQQNQLSQSLANYCTEVND